MGKGFVFKSGIRVSSHACSCKRVTAFYLKILFRTVRVYTILEQLFEAVALRVSSKYHTFVSSLCFVLLKN